MPEMKNVSLADIASQFAKKDASFTFFHGKLFSYIPISPDQCAKFVQGLKLGIGTFPNSHPATVLIGRLAPLVRHQAKEVLAMENGQLKIHFEVTDLKLPDCNYLAIVSPAQKINQTSAYGKAFQSINFIRSLMSAPLGKLPFYTWIADFDFDANGQISIQSKAVRMPLYADLATVMNLAFANELCDRLSKQQPAMRQRPQLACNFYSSAMDQENSAFRFSSYWIALEILVGGKSDAIRTMLAKAYDEANKSFSDDHLFYREIENVRHNLMHKGQFGGLRSYHERLLQLYFWDIVSYRVGLKSNYALSLAKTGIIDVERKDIASRTQSSGAPTWMDADPITATSIPTSSERQ